MKIKLKLEGKSGVRFKGWCLGVTAYPYWWSYGQNKWVSSEDKSNDGKGASSHAMCKCTRQFKRMLRKKPWIVDSAVLVSRYQGVGDITVEVLK